MEVGRTVIAGNIINVVAVNRVKKSLPYKKLFPRFVNFKEGAKLAYGCVLFISRLL